MDTLFVLFNISSAHLCFGKCVFLFSAGEEGHAYGCNILPPCRFLVALFTENTFDMASVCITLMDSSNFRASGIPIQTGQQITFCIHPYCLVSATDICFVFSFHRLSCCCNTSTGFQLWTHIHLKSLCSQTKTIKNTKCSHHYTTDAKTRVAVFLALHVTCKLYKCEF